MSEAEFEKMLAVVQQVLAPRDVADFIAECSVAFAQPLNAANENEISWPFYAFPDGWIASC